MYDEIKQISPNVVYLNGNGETVPPPVNADTANMIFVEAGGYVVGFTNITEDERLEVISFLDIPSIEERLEAAELLINILLDQ
jgi:hypothetical protein